MTTNIPEEQKSVLLQVVKRLRRRTESGSLDWGQVEEDGPAFTVANRQTFLLKVHDQESLRLWAEDETGRTLWQVEDGFAKSLVELSTQEELAEELWELSAAVEKARLNMAAEGVRSSLEALTAA